MVAPGTPRKGKYREGVIQIRATGACDMSCCNCTQGSSLTGAARHMSIETFKVAVRSLKGYWGVIGLFGGNPAAHPDFGELCRILADEFPKEQLGIWCNNPITVERAKVMDVTFNPAVSNLNVHMSSKAHGMFQEGWPGSRPFGLYQDSRHAPVFVSMREVGVSEERRWELIADCDINKHWSAMVAEFRGSARAYFCEVAGAQAMMHQDEPDYPDTGAAAVEGWWKAPMQAFAEQVQFHCHDCGVPLRGRGELAVTGDAEHMSPMHAREPRRGRRIEMAMAPPKKTVPRFVDYIKNSALV